MNIRALSATLVILAGLTSALGQVVPPKPPVTPAKPLATTKPATPIKPAPPKPEFEISRSIKIGGEGKWESVTVDDTAKNLYIARKGRMQVLDLTENKIKGEILVRFPRAVTLVPSLNRGFVMCGAENQVLVFHIPTLDVLGRIDVAGHPAAAAYDPTTKKIFICCPEGKCLTPIPADIDPKTGKPEKSIELNGRPSSIVIDSHGAAFVSLNDQDQIALIETKSSTVLTRWPTGIATRPAGLSIDEPRARIFAALRGRLGIYSLADGHEIAGVDIRAPQTESTAYCNGKIFVCTTDGQIHIVGPASDGIRYELQQSFNMGLDACVAAPDPKTNTVYIPAQDYENRRPVKDSFKVNVLGKTP